MMIFYTWQELDVVNVYVCFEINSVFGLYSAPHDPYLSGLLHGHWGNHMIAPVTVTDMGKGAHN